MRKDLELQLDNASRISKKGKEVLIFGTGNALQVNKSVLDEEKIIPAYFVDNNRNKIGESLWGIEIILPEMVITKCENPIVFICSRNPDMCLEMKDQMSKLIGEENTFLLEELLLGRHKEEILEVYDSLADEFSKKTYEELIVARLMGSEINEEIVVDNQYFCLKEFLKRNPSEIFVDCGAYVGDSIECYINRKAGVFGKIIAFEPNGKIYDAMAKRVKRLTEEWGLCDDKIVTVKAGCGSKREQLFLDTEGEELSIKLGEEYKGECVEVCTLDASLRNQRIDFIKADIEGMEIDLLNGAANIVKNEKPLLAICIYHKTSDIYKIPLLIRKLNESYKLKVRQHHYSYCETVLYAF